MSDDMRLKVVSSTIDGKGIAKLDSDSFRSMKLSEGTSIIITYGAKSVELAATLDTVFSPSSLRLMKADMDSLRVEVGTEVTVSRKNGTAPEKRRKAGKKGKKAKAASLDRF